MNVDQAISHEVELFGLRVVDYVPDEDVPDDDDREWLATGDSWRVWRDGDVYMMQYQSGEHGGGVRAIAIDDHDFAELRDGSTTSDAVLIRHHAS